MPELPDVAVYVEALERRVIGHRLEEIRLSSPFVLRTVVPPVAEAQGRRVTGVRRLGKRIVIALEGEIFLVLHLMIAGRLRWLSRGSQAAGAHHAGDLRVRHRRAGVHRSGHAQARLAAPRRKARPRWRRSTAAASSSTTSMPPPSLRA